MGLCWSDWRVLVPGMLGVQGAGTCRHCREGRGTSAACRGRTVAACMGEVCSTSGCKESFGGGYPHFSLFLAIHELKIWAPGASAVPSASGHGHQCDLNRTAVICGAGSSGDCGSLSSPVNSQVWGATPGTCGSPAWHTRRVLPGLFCTAFFPFVRHATSPWGFCGEPRSSGRLPQRAVFPFWSSNKLRQPLSAAVAAAAQCWCCGLLVTSVLFTSSLVLVAAA